MYLDICTTAQTNSLSPFQIFSLPDMIVIKQVLSFVL